MVILTKTDALVTDLNTNATAEKVFTDEGVKKVVHKVSDLLGLQMNAIFPVKNYESEIDLDEDIDILALMALRQMLYLCEDCTENRLICARPSSPPKFKSKRKGRDDKPTKPEELEPFTEASDVVFD